MNLSKLFETQKILDRRIIKQHGLEGQDLLPEKILALQVELGECANEWRGFKFWSKDKEPRTNVAISCECPYCYGHGTDAEDTETNLLLEEYVDCLHFILSIGLDLKQEQVEVFSFDYASITTQFSELFADISRIDTALNVYSKFDLDDSYFDAFCEFIGLGKLLGFTWEQIEQAYFTKNRINHTRQDTGY